MASRLRRERPWRFVLPRWFKCWRKTHHAPRTFASSTLQWTECFCGLRCSAPAPRAAGEEDT